MVAFNTTCKNCSKLFHTCSSCNLVGFEWDFCSENCWEKAGKPHYDLMPIKLSERKGFALLKPIQVNEDLNIIREFIFPNEE